MNDSMPETRAAHWQENSNNSLRSLKLKPKADPNSSLRQAEGVMLDFFKGFLDVRPHPGQPIVTRGHPSCHSTVLGSVLGSGSAHGTVQSGLDGALQSL